MRVIAYSQAVFWYTSTNKGYIMTYKNYSIAKEAKENSILEKQILFLVKKTIFKKKQSLFW